MRYEIYKEYTRVPKGKAKRQYSMGNEVLLFPINDTMKFTEPFIVNGDFTECISNFVANKGKEKYFIKTELTY